MLNYYWTIYPENEKPFTIDLSTIDMIKFNEEFKFKNYVITTEDKEVFVYYNQKQNASYKNINEIDEYLKREDYKKEFQELVEG